MNSSNVLSFRGHLNYPSISQIKKGRVDRSRINFEVTPTTFSGTAAVEQLTKGQSKSLEGFVVVTISGLLKSKLSTSAALFHNVVGLQMIFQSFKVMNAKDSETTAALDGEMSLATKGLTTTDWYAPGQSVVSVWTVTSTGQKTVEDSSCNT